MSKIPKEVIENHGISLAEFNMILKIIKREPNLLELGIFSVMWSDTVHINQQKMVKNFAHIRQTGDCGLENAGI